MERRFHSALRLAASCVLACAFAAPALAAAGTIVHVTLWDKGQDAPMAMDEGMGMTHADMANRMMGIKLDRQTVKAGDVTFEVTNGSRETVHEMIVLPVPADGKLPYDEQEARFDEDEAGALGEVSELDPGKRGALRLHLQRGRYVLSCNVANHFANGMWSLFTVQ